MRRDLKRLCKSPLELKSECKGVGSLVETSNYNGTLTRLGA